MPPRFLHRFRLLLAACLLAFGLAMPAAAADTPLRIKVVGGLAGLSQYTNHEVPFWRTRVPEITQGRLAAEISPFDRSGIRGQEMLQLMRLGVVQFGTMLLGLAASEEPELNALDLPLLMPSLDVLRQTTPLLRPQIASVLGDRYGVELLAIYVYPAQVLFCQRAFSSLADLRDRKVRTATVGQSELMRGLGATPVQTAFTGVVPAVRAGAAECAITGTLSGNQIGLHEVTSHVSSMAITWGVGIFAANRAAWMALPAPDRDALRQGLAELQEEIWTAAAAETAAGLACNSGRPACLGGTPGRMTVVDHTERDEAQRRDLLARVVLPGWIHRCGPPCAEAWNRYLAPSLGIPARVD